jgi:uncharacterized protein (TIGR02594 family)
MLLNIFQAIFGLLAASISIAGNTWDATKPKLLHKITTRGWCALVFAGCTFVVTVIKEIKSEAEAASKDQRSGRIETKLELALDKIAALSSGTPQAGPAAARLADALRANQSDSVLQKTVVPAPPVTVAEPKWLALARGEVGVKETGRLPGNPRILKYLASTNLVNTDLNETIPWSAAFVNWSLRQSGMSTPNSASGVRWESWGIGIPTPRLGCVAIINRNSRGRHIGLVVTYNETSVTLISGDISNKVAYQDFPRKNIAMYRCPD